MKSLYSLLMLIICLPVCVIGSQLINFSQPDNPNACVPEIIYHSPFEGYQPQRPIKLQSWRKANEAAGSQPMSHMQHMNMPMKGSQSNSKDAPQQNETSEHSHH